MQPFHYQLLIIVSLVFSSCGNNQDNTIVIDDEAQKVDVLFGKNNHTPLQVTEAVSEITSQWGAYNDFTEDITKINRNTIDELKVLSDRLVVSSDSLYRFIPDTLNTKPIASRLIVLQTRIKLLQQQLGFDRLDTVKVEEHISEINSAHTTFISQINEKFLKDGINQEQKDVEQREIEQRKLDSIFRAELKDNNRN